MDCGKKIKDCWKGLSGYKDGLLLLLFLLWLAFYVFCGKLSRHTDMSEKDFVSLCRALLNVLITFIVLVVTYRDRFKQFSALAKNARIDEDMPKLKGLFVPLALAIVPFTSAMTDLADSTEYHTLVPNLVIVLLFIISLLETVSVYKFKQSRDFTRKFWVHIFLLIVLAILFIRPSLLFSWFF